MQGTSSSRTRRLALALRENLGFARGARWGVALASVSLCRQPEHTKTHLRRACNPGTLFQLGNSR